MEALALEAVPGFAVPQRIAPDDFVRVLPLDERIGTADRPGFVVVLLAKEIQIGALVPGTDKILDSDSIPPVPQAGS